MDKDIGVDPLVQMKVQVDNPDQRIEGIEITNYIAGSDTEPRLRGTALVGNIQIRVYPDSHGSYWVALHRIDYKERGDIISQIDSVPISRLTINNVTPEDIEEVLDMYRQRLQNLGEDQSPESIFRDTYEHNRVLIDKLLDQMKKSGKR